MHVLYFHQHFSTPKGSSGIRSYYMAKKLVDRGHKVTVVCGNYNRAVTGLSSTFKNGVRYGQIDGIDIIEFDMSYSNSDNYLKRTWVFIMYAIRSIKVSLSLDYDIVFSTTTPLTAGLPGIFARWLRNKKFVFEVRDLWPELPKKMGVIKNPVVLSLLSILEWVSYKSAHRIIGLSPGIVDGIKERGIEDNIVSMIPNGCDLSIFDSNNAELPWRPEGIANSDLMAVYTGTHGVANGLDSVLKAAKFLVERGSGDIKIVLVGQGKLKNKLQLDASNEGLNNVFFHDPVDKKKLSGLLSSADIGLQVLSNVPAFYYGTSPNKFFDYIASGLPVINNYPGWLADMITELKCGYVIPPEDPEAFADALEEANRNRLCLIDQGRASSDLAVNKFNRDHLSDEWVDWVTGVGV